MRGREENSPQWQQEVLKVSVGQRLSSPACRNPFKVDSLLKMRLCWQIPVPPLLLQVLLMVDARAPAALAVAPLAVMLADARAPAALAAAPLAVMQADARAPAALADAPDADMIADARAPAFLAVACSGLWMW